MLKLASRRLRPKNIIRQFTKSKLCLDEYYISPDACNNGKNAIYVKESEKIINPYEQSPLDSNNTKNLSDIDELSKIFVRQDNFKKMFEEQYQKSYKPPNANILQEIANGAIAGVTIFALFYGFCLLFSF